MRAVEVVEELVVVQVCQLVMLLMRQAAGQHRGSLH